MTDFVPQNPLEQALLDGKAGRLSLPEFIKILLGSPILVVSATDTQATPHFEPLLYPHPTEPDVRMIAVYSSAERIGPDAQKAPHVLEVNTADFLQRLAPGKGGRVGLVLNPRDAFGFELQPAAIDSLMESLRARAN